MPADWTHHVHAQDEVHEVMQALEELAVSYDSKDREIESIVSEKALLMEEMEELQVTTPPLFVCM